MAKPSLPQRLHQKIFGPTARAGEITLDRQRIYILPTLAGVLYALLLLLILLGAINYDLALGHALVFLLAGLGLVGMVHTFRNLLGLHLTVAGAIAPVFAGETAYLPLRLEHRGRQPRRALEVGGEDSWMMGHLEARGSTTLKLPLATHRRGRQAVCRLTVSSSYPLGLFRAWAYFHPEQSLLVFPAPLCRPLPLFRSEGEAGERQGQAGRDDFAGLRPQQPGDLLAHIAWKAAARQQEDGPLPVKHFAGGNTPRLQLRWQDLAPGIDRETGLSILAGWILEAEARGIAYGLSLAGQDIGPALGPTHRHRCLEALALHPGAGETAP